MVHAFAAILITERLYGENESHLSLLHLPVHDRGAASDDRRDQE